MSYEDGWAAINLEMPKRVPRTEYSAHEHWDLLRVVTGIDIDKDSPWGVKQKAHKAFVGPEGWNYDFFWSIWVYTQFLEKCRTEMGHAEYAADGSDFRQAILSPFKDPIEVLSFEPEEIYGNINESDNMKYIAEKYGKTHVFIGNADTRVLLKGDRSEIRNEVQRCMNIGKSCPGYFMAVGNHIPPNTPVENALYYNEVYEDLSRR